MRVMVSIVFLLGCSADVFDQAVNNTDGDVDSNDPVTSDSGADVFTLDGELTDSHSDSDSYIDSTTIPDTSLNCGSVSMIPKLCTYDTCLFSSGYSCASGYYDCTYPIDVYCYKPLDCSSGDHCCYNDNVTITSCSTTVTQFQSTACMTICPKSRLCLVDKDCSSGQKCYPVTSTNPMWSFGLCQ
jgi:hypothetical protein